MSISTTGIHPTPSLLLPTTNPQPEASHYQDLARLIATLLELLNEMHAQNREQLAFHQRQYQSFSTEGASDAQSKANVSLIAGAASGILLIGNLVVPIIKPTLLSKDTQTTITAVAHDMIPMLSRGGESTYDAKIKLTDCQASLEQQSIQEKQKNNDDTMKTQLLETLALEGRRITTASGN